MADEHKTETTHTLETKEGQVVFQSQADFDAVITRRLAKEKEKFADYDDTKAKLEQLTKEKDERELAQLSEVEKAKKEAADAKAKIEELSTYKTKLEEYETQQADKFTEMMTEAEFTEAQIARVNKLPLGDRADMIADLKNASKLTPPDNAGKPNGHSGTLTKQQILSMPDGPEKTALYAKWRRDGGIA